MKLIKILTCMFTLFSMTLFAKIDNDFKDKKIIQNCNFTNINAKITENRQCPKCSATSLVKYADGMRCSDNTCQFRAQLTSNRPCTTFLHKNKKEEYEVYLLSCQECGSPLLLNSYIAHYHFCSNKYCHASVPSKDPIYKRSRHIRKMFEEKQEKSHSYCKICKKGIIEIHICDKKNKKRLTINICSVPKIIDIKSVSDNQLKHYSVL